MRAASKIISHMLMLSIGVLFIAACGLAGAEVEKLPSDAGAALKNATNVTAYSLEPKMMQEGKNNLHGFVVLGDVRLSGQEAKDVANEYSDALQEYLDETRLHGNSATGCIFQPHHALRIVTSDNHTYDYIVCFNCGQIEVYKDNARYWSGQVRGTAVKLDEMFQAHHVPVSKTAN